MMDCDEEEHPNGYFPLSQSPVRDSAKKYKWTLEEEKRLFEAVKENTTRAEPQLGCGGLQRKCIPKKRKIYSWDTIRDLHFKGLKTNQLKQKWKEMIKSADKQNKNAERKELYLEVKKLHARLSKDKRNSP